MTYKRGASNGYKFAVPPGSFAYRSGETQTQYRGVTMGWEDRHNDNTLIRAWSVPAPGETVLWEYPNQTGFQRPQVWAILQSDGTILYIWENEERFDLFRDEINPFITTKQNNDSIIPAGGTVIKLFLGGYSQETGFPGVLDQAEDDVIAASLPTWISDNIELKNLTDTNQICQSIFRRMQIERGIQVLVNQPEHIERARIPLPQKETLALLYLRAASMVVMDHAGETCVPLLTTNYTADTTYGFLTHV